jgi:hypothetical protein
MGLDMYLTGNKFLPESSSQEQQQEDGYPLKERRLELGYWRKQPNLHGYIVDTFADGVDNCQEIELSKAAIADIIDAITNGRLPPTEGFFFGEQDDSEEQKRKDIEIFEKALTWLKNEVRDKAWRAVTYRASW